jgi:S1/P1 nuclease
MRDASASGAEMRIPKLFVIACVAIWSSPARPWGLDGHRTIGAVADLILKDEPAGAVAREILGTTLSEAGTWADCAKGYCGRPLSPDERAYVQANPQHKEYHYTDIAIQQTSYQLGTAGTRNDDVVQIINQTVAVLRGGAANQGPAVLDQKSALWVMAHMVGDVHQPLHVGAIYYDQSCDNVVDPNVTGAGQPNFGIGVTSVSTHGGNDLQLPNKKSFHVYYWDRGVVTGAMRLADVRNKSIDDFAQYIVAHPPVSSDTAGDPSTWAAQWATEVMPIANAALTKITIGQPSRQAGRCTWPVKFDREYTEWANQQALALLTKAGFRLAAMVRAVLQTTTPPMLPIPPAQ